MEPPTHRWDMSPNSDSASYQLQYTDEFLNWLLSYGLTIPSQSVHPDNAAVDVAPHAPTTSVDYYAWGNIQPVIPNFTVPPSADPLANVANTAPVVASVGQATPSTSSAPTSQNNSPTCPHCANTHRRPVLYRACRNKHLGLRPFICAGECGKQSCVQAFASYERKMAHTRGRVTCDKCGKPGWKKNQARHRASCNPVV